MDLSKPCSCGGWTENCCRCAGTGYIIEETKVNRYSFRPTEAFKPQADSTQKKGTNNNVAIGLPRKPLKSNKVTIYSANASLIRCSFCKCLVKSSRLGKHYARCPKRNTECEIAGSVTPPTGDRTSMCPGRRGALDCISTTTSENGHGRISTKEPMRSKLPARRSNHDTSARKLDGSGDYWRIRDDGRFGSHPSFDNMNDESKP